MVAPVVAGLARTIGAAFRPVVMGGMRRTMQSTAGGVRAGSRPVIGPTTSGVVADTVVQSAEDNAFESMGEAFSRGLSDLGKRTGKGFESLTAGLQSIVKNLEKENVENEKVNDVIEDAVNQSNVDQNEEDRRESLERKTGDGKGIIQSLKDAFESFKGFFSNMMPDSDLGKVGLFGGLAALIAMNFDKLVKPLAAALKFLDEKILPGVKVFAKTVKEDFGGDDGVLSKLFTGDDSVMKGIFSGFGDILDGFREDDPEKKIAGAKKLLLDVPLQFVSAVGLGVASIVDATLKMFGIESEFVKDTKEFFRELPETVRKFARKTKAFFTDGFADLTNSIKNIFVDIEVADGPAGAVRTQRSVIGKIKDEMLQNFKNNVQSIKDFFFDEEGNLFGINFSAMADMMPTLQEIVDTIVSSLPKWMRPDTLTEKLADAEADLIKAQDKLDSNPDYAPYIKKVEKAQAKVDKIKGEIETKFPGSLNEVETNNFNEIFNN